MKLGFIRNIWMLLHRIIIKEKGDQIIRWAGLILALVSGSTNSISDRLMTATNQTITPRHPITDVSLMTSTPEAPASDPMATSAEEFSKFKPRDSVDNCNSN